jgi:hypothetical protein
MAPSRKANWQLGPNSLMKGRSCSLSMLDDEPRPCKARIFIFDGWDSRKKIEKEKRDQENWVRTEYPATYQECVCYEVRTTSGISRFSKLERQPPARSGKGVAKYDVFSLTEAK